MFSGRWVVVVGAFGRHGLLFEVTAAGPVRTPPLPLLTDSQIDAGPVVKVLRSMAQKLVPSAGCVSFLFAGAAMNRRSSMRMVSMVKSRFQFAMLGSLVRSTCANRSACMPLRYRMLCAYLSCPLIHARDVDFADERDFGRDIGVVGAAVDFDGVYPVLVYALFRQQLVSCVSSLV